MCNRVAIIKERKIIKLQKISDLFAVVLACWLSVMLVFNSHIKGTDLYSDIPLTLFGMFLMSHVFFFIGLVLSAIFTERGKAAQYSAIVVVTAYLLSVMIEMSGKINYLNFISPFRYFDAARVLDKGIESLYVILSAAIIAVTGYFTYFLYQSEIYIRDFLLFFE